MTTIKDISREAGVSMAVVSVVLNNITTGRIKASAATAERIRNIARRLAYRPNLVARQLTGKKSGIIGVVMDSCSSQIYYDRLSKMEIHAASKGYRFMIGQAHNDVDKIKDYAQFFAGYAVDGIICMAHDYPAVDGKCSSGIAEFFTERCRTVFLKKPSEIADCYSVTIDLAYNFHEAVRYLASTGRKKIAFFKLSGFYEGPTMSIAESGYRKGLDEAGLKFDPRLVKSTEVEHMKLYEKLEKQVRELQKAGVDAIIAVNDFIGAGVLKCLQLSGVKVPDKIAVVGCDNLDIAGLIHPGLTTFDQNNDQVAVRLVDLLADLIENRPVTQSDGNIVIRPTMIRRESA